MQSSSSPYILEHIRTMRHQEMTAYKLTTNYLQHNIGESVHSIKITASDRETMLSWAYDTVDACNLERHVAITAIAYLDRFLSNSSCRLAKLALSSRQEYQLCFIACLIISIKTRAGMNVGSRFISNQLCHGVYTEEEVLQTEIEILNGLGWKLNGPTAIDFAHAFLQLMPQQSDEEVLDFLMEAAEAQVETAMMSYSLSLQEPSSIAYSSILNVMQCMGCSDVDIYVWVRSVSFIAGLNADNSTCKLIRQRMMEITSTDQTHFFFSSEEFQANSSQLSPTSSVALLA